MFSAQCGNVHGFSLLLTMLIVAVDDLCLQARWEARGLREGGSGDGCGEEDGGARQPERQTRTPGQNRRLWAALSSST